ncbi:MAG: DNA-binding response regulator [Anaerolineae bacterium]|nr:response regulator transcription factor [Anaerolineales bacterium]MCQ3975675.1 DNA-binding response regulator [Anaerolineae bacterium]
MDETNILVIDDDLVLLALVQQVLCRAGWHVDTATSGPKGMARLQTLQPDLVILDIMMPGMDGWEVCRHIRRISCVPVMMLTALSEERYIIRALSDYGADDYLVKPFSADLLVARVKALLRRGGLLPLTQTPVIYQDGYLTINLALRQVWAQNRLVKLTKTEYRLLIYLLQHTDRTPSFFHILEQVWGSEYHDSVEYVHVYISRLRQKIEENPKEPHYLLTMHGVGYRFQPFPPARPAQIKTSPTSDPYPLGVQL